MVHFFGSQKPSFAVVRATFNDVAEMLI